MACQLGVHLLLKSSISHFHPAVLTLLLWRWFVWSLDLLSCVAIFMVIEVLLGK